MSDLAFRPQDLGIGHLFERVRDAVIVADARTGRIVLWNPAATEIFGYSVHEALEMNVEGLVPEPFRERHRAGLARYRETGHGPYIDSRELLALPALRKTGEEIRIEMSLSPIGPLRGVGDKDRRYALAVVRDITERKRAEEEVRQLNEELENRVRERTARLEAALGELRASEERHRLLVDNVEDYAIFMVDPNGRVLDWNVGAERIFGYREEEIVGEPGSILFTPEDIRSGAPERELGKAEEEGRAVDERWHMRKDGSRFWTNGFVRPIRDDAGNLRGFAKVARDITERRRFEEELERRARLLDLTQDAVMVRDADSRITFWNRGAEEMYGWSSEQAVGRVSHELLHTRFPEPLERIEEELMRHGRWEGELEYDTRGGKKVVTSRWALQMADDGGVGFILETNTDVTERKRAEEELRESESSLSAAQRIAHLGNWDYDIARDEAYWSDELYRIFGFAPKAFVPTYRKFLDLLHPDDREHLRREVRAALYGDRERGHTSVEYRVVRPDGEVRFVNIRYEVVRGASGRPVRLIGTIHDVTERKKAEEALLEIREAERSRIARDLHDGVLQDLSYTAAVMGLMMLDAKGTSLEDRLQGAIDAARRAADGLRAAVNDLRVEEGRDRTLPESVQSLVERHRGMVRGYEIRLEVEEGLSATPIGDAGAQVLRVLQEALTNARRHSEAGNVKVRLSKDGDELVAEVADDGRGFGAGITPGVGLRSMRERAEALGGKLEIESQVGRGTRVRLRVPIPQKG